MHRLATLTTATALALILALGFGGTAKADPDADAVAVDGINNGSCGGNCLGSASDTLEAPDGVFASLGNLGFVTLNFTDNVCFVGTGDDVTVTEIGDPEGYTVAVGLIGGTLSAGVVGAGTDSIDLTSTGVSVFNQAKITDDDNTSGTNNKGADIDAIECLSTLDQADIEKATVDHPSDTEAGHTNDKDTIFENLDTQQFKAFTITISNNTGVADGLAGLTFLDVVPAEFDVQSAVVTGASGGGVVGDCTALDLGEPTKSAGQSGAHKKQKLAPDFVTITAPTLDDGESCTITVKVETDGDHPGGGNSPDFTPTNCTTIVLNNGVRVLDASGNILLEDDDSLTLTCV